MSRKPLQVSRQQSYWSKNERFYELVILRKRWVVRTFSALRTQWWFLSLSSFDERLDQLTELFNINAQYSCPFPRSLHVCMYVCMYVNTYVCVYVCMYVCMYVCTRMHACVYLYINEYKVIWHELSWNEFLLGPRFCLLWRQEMMWQLLPSLPSPPWRLFVCRFFVVRETKNRFAVLDTIHGLEKGGIKK